MPTPMRDLTHQEVRKLVIETLRSGRFNQTNGVLRSSTGYCCLGVMCELAVEHGVIEPGKYMKSDDFYRYGTQKTALPEKVQEWVGLKNCCGTYKRDKDSQDQWCPSLVSLNDGGKTFQEIADVIQQAPDGLFVD